MTAAIFASLRTGILARRAVRGRYWLKALGASAAVSIPLAYACAGLTDTQPGLHVARSMPQVKHVSIELGNVSVEGELSPVGTETVHGDLTLTIRDTPKVKVVQYFYRIDVPSSGNEEMVFGAGPRRMYALLPSGAYSWDDVLRLGRVISTELDLVRLEGAAEEEE